MNIYKRLFSYTPERMGYAYLSIFFSIISGFLSIAPFWYLWKFLEQLIVHQDLETGMYYATIIVLLMIANAVTYFLALASSHILAFRLETNMRKAGIKQLMRASFSFFDMNASGKIRKIIDDNASETHTIVAHLIPDLILAILTPILMIITTFMVDIKLGAFLVGIVIIGIFLVMGMTGNKEFMSNYMASLEKMNAEAVEYVRGMQVIKVFRTRVHSIKAFYKAITDYSDYALNFSMSCRTPFVSFQVLFNLFATFTIPIGILLMDRGASVPETLARIIFFICFAGTMFSCIMKVMYVSMFQFKALQAVDKLENFFTQMEKNQLQYGDEERFDDYSIEFKNVSFKYEDEYVLRDLSFRLSGGKSYALVGASGGGKTTIAKLVSGFYKIDEGEILIGGKNIESYSQKALMENIAFVFQHSKLFQTSIYENVKIGNPNASDEEVLEALKLAQCDDILDKFREREHTVIGSKGVYLSGGETQRIAIARAILKNANIIILDEASAAADPENEYEIQLAFSNLMKGKTVLMIAHRLSSIRKVDEILVVQDGKIIERGTDEQLMQPGTRYKSLQDMFSKANDWRVYD